MSAGKNCSVFGCYNTQLSTKNVKPMVSFYPFPGQPWEKDRRSTWANFTKRKNLDGTRWQPTANSRICSQHFVSGWKSQNPRTPNYNPSIYPSLHEPTLKDDKKVERYERSVRRKPKAGGQEERSLPEIVEMVDAIDTCREISTQTDDTDCQFGELIMFISIIEKDGEAGTLVSHHLLPSALTSPVTTVDKCAGPNRRSCIFMGFESVNVNLNSLRDLTATSPNVFSVLLGLLPTYPGNHGEITWENKLLNLLMKLKLGLTYNALGALLGIHPSTARKVFLEVLSIIYYSTAEWIFWPTKFAVQRTMPKAFKEYYPDTRVIIDCTEIKCERPPGVNNQAHMYSQYKNAWTVKYLVGMTPSGFISFMSKGYGGRSTDSYITANSGFLNKLERGDIVMADKGFPHVNFSISEKDAVLVMPPFATPNCPQFSQEDMNETYRIASVRIHVERIIQRLKFFKVLQNRLQITMLPYIDQIMHACCILVSLQSDIIKEGTD